MHTRDLPCQHVDPPAAGSAFRSSSAWDWERSMRRRRRLVLLVLNVPRTGIRSGSSDCNSWLMHACDDCCNTVPVGLIFATHLSLSLSFPVFSSFLF